MKKICTSLNLNLLAEKMMDEIKSQWKPPLSPPLVIFSDSKVEQWFKLQWIQKNSSVLLNLKTLRLEEFLFNLLPHSASTKMLTQDLLRDCLIKKLSEKNYIKSLGSKEVSDYLFDSVTEQKINSIRLYDFALQMSELFTEYEITRPDSLDKIFSKCKWQKKLYDDIFENGSGINLSEKNFLSLLQLKNKTQGKMNWNPEQSVFLFGFSGMGQLYRNLLLDFSAENNLFVYLQISDANQNKKSLLYKWGELAFENLELWTRDSKNLEYENLPAEFDEKSILLQTQKSFAQNSVIEQIKKTDSSISLTSSPTKVREVEALHSKICALLKDKSARLSDILILAPNIQDYTVAIEQVFDQSDFSAPGTKYPYIPYVIADYSSEHSLVADAVQILFSIVRKKYLCRSDLFMLLRNSLVQHTRHFSSSDVSNWFLWTNEMHIYRDRENPDEDSKILDWENAKTRLLLSRLTDDVIDADGMSFIPYETLDSDSDISLYKFIEVIDDLEKWISIAVSPTKSYSPKQIDEIAGELKKWFSLPQNPPENLKSEKFIFKALLSEIENLKSVAQSSETSNAKFDAECFSFALIDAAEKTVLHNTSILSGGVTFATLKPNGTLSAKYVFILGADSKSLPGTEIKNVLDLRFSDDEKNQTGDDSIPKKNRLVFLQQLMAAGEGFFISYVNKNLQKDEDFYKSSLLQHLFDDKAEIRLNIDEDRNWSELYTSREFRNKQLYLRRNESGGEKEKKSSEKKQSVSENEKGKNYPDRVTISQIKRFLSDPFVFYAENLFTRDEDNSDEEKLEFEPIQFDALTNSKFKKTFIQNSLSSDTDFKDEFMQNLKLDNLLPDGKFGDIAFDDLQKECEEIKKQILEVFKNPGAITFEKSLDLPITGQKISEDSEKIWNLTGQTLWHSFSTDEQSQKKLILADMNNSKNPLGTYVSSLALIANQNEESDFNVELHVFSSKEKDEPISFKMSRSEARTNLKEIYSAMFVEGFHKCVPFSVLQNILEKPDNDFKKFSNLKDKLSGDFAVGEWKYFSKKDLFDLRKDIGYTENGFAGDTGEWSVAKKKMIGLIKFLKNKEKISNEQ